MDALIFCRDEALQKDIHAALARIGLKVESWRNSQTVAERAVQLRPALLVLYSTGDDRWAGAAIAEIRRLTPRTKIIYATRRPGPQDAAILEQGVSYYAGNAPIEEIVDAANAVCSRPSRVAGEARAADSGENADERRYQIRLRPDERLAELFALLLSRIRGALRDVPAWGELSAAELASVDVELRKALDHYVAAYDLCGLKASCFELADPLGRGTAPDPAVAEPRDWDGVRILQLELKRDVSEFSDAVESSVLRALCRKPGRASTAREARAAVSGAVREVFGARLFRSIHGECDVCKVVERIDPWSIGAR